MTQSYDVLIKEVEYDCPFCNEVHTIQIRKRWTEALVKGEVVEYEEVYYKCDKQQEDEDDEFVPAYVLDINLAKAKEAYKIKHERNEPLHWMHYDEYVEKYGVPENLKGAM